MARYCQNFNVLMNRWFKLLQMYSLPNISSTFALAFNLTHLEAEAPLSCGCAVLTARAKSKDKHGSVKQATNYPIYYQSVKKVLSNGIEQVLIFPTQWQIIPDTDPSLQDQCCGYNIQIHTDYRNPVEKKGWHGHSLSERG